MPLDELTAKGLKRKAEAEVNAKLQSASKKRDQEEKLKATSGGGG